MGGFALLINSIPFQYDSSGLDLYWRLYNYRLVVPFNSIYRVRYYTTIDQFNARLNGHKSMWGRQFFENTRRDIIENGGSINELSKFIECRETLLGSIKTLIVNHCINLYYNDFTTVEEFLDVFKKRDSCYGFYRVKNTLAEPGVVYLSNPQSEYRLYVNTKRLSGTVCGELNNFIETHNASACRIIKQNLRVYRENLSHSFLIQKNNFIDVKTEQLTTLFALYFPELLYKVCRIQPKEMINTFGNNLELPHGTDL